MIKQYTVSVAYTGNDEVTKYIDGKPIDYKIMPYWETYGYCNALEDEGYSRAYDLDELLEELISAKEAYEKLNEAAELCISGMKSIYGAWSYAKSNTNQFGSFRVDGISLGKAAPAANSHIHDGIKALGIESGDLVSWTYAGYIAQAALEAKGEYNTVSTDMEEAGDIIRTLSQNEDSSYYPKLNEYYSAVYSYVVFFEEPSGNDLEQISDVMSNHEKEISSADAGFLFYK